MFENSVDFGYDVWWMNVWKAVIISTHHFNDKKSHEKFIGKEKKKLTWRQSCRLLWKFGSEGKILIPLFYITLLKLGWNLKERRKPVRESQRKEYLTRHTSTKRNLHATEFYRFFLRARLLIMCFCMLRFMALIRV